ncbi:MAG: altronate dehydratase [Planctomycetota bacterium]|nr:MAG: altronate dehydratase [Planctomycetota bacterium]
MLQASPIDVIVLHARDNVCVATRDLPSGTRVTVGDHTVELSEPVRLGHKIALMPITSGEQVLKYGQIIGFATADIAPGAWIHTHNLAAGAFDRDYAASTEVPPDPERLTGLSFEGYRRPDRKPGTRNYVAVISTVNCSATVSKAVAARFGGDALRDYPNVDGVVAFTHGGGCGMQFGGEGHATLNRVLGGIARHPNIGGYVIIGLGCETASLGYLLDDQKLVQIGGGSPSNAKRPPVLSMQDAGGTPKTIEAACRLVEQILPQANDVRRESFPLAELILGTNCGGSDGNSGITANPALGVASDMIVAAGGTVVLGETTEIYGAEQLLTRRARTPEVAQKLVDRIRWWEWYTGLFGCTPDNNPSPGNKEGGLTTIYEKSLGAIAKAGGTALSEVYQYAEPVTASGFVVMDTPGLDPVSVTGIVAGGAQVMVFTTGRGSCFGCKPTPSIKVSTNTPMYQRMIDDMDLDAGQILAGQSVDSVGRQILDEIIAVASGKKTKSEQHGIGQEEFVPWNIGPTL